jgi:enoyl-CoA hydratase/carnithine racemase
MSPVLFEVAEEVATITLANPEGHNVMDLEMLGGLREALANAESAGVRVIVLAAQGPSFCAGADLRAVEQGDSTSFAGAAAPELAKTLQAWMRTSLPVVACVQGSAAGGGLGLLAVADVVVASTSATFAFREVRVGVAPAVIAVPLLRHFAHGTLGELMLSGRRLDAGQAQALGLVHHVASPELLEANVSAVVSDLRHGGPEAQATVKAMLPELARLDEDEAWRRAVEITVGRFQSAEASEGIDAFRTKRRPRWAP